ncbi:unnamed protein product [Closterium sp. NIES-64]|nr:unnamed protein product [Closterium sp. NIES-64]
MHQPASPHITLFCYLHSCPIRLPCLFTTPTTIFQYNPTLERHLDTGHEDSHQPAAAADRIWTRDMKTRTNLQQPQIVLLSCQRCIWTRDMKTRTNLQQPTSPALTARSSHRTLSPLSIPTGIWTRDMKTRTNLQQPQITKIIKTLEGRKLIKAVKSVNNKSRKLYMLYELEPSREVTGGAWYTDAEFDAEFISALRQLCLTHIVKLGGDTLEGVVEAVRRAGSGGREDLRMEDFRQVGGRRGEIKGEKWKGEEQ